MPKKPDFTEYKTYTVCLLRSPDAGNSPEIVLVTQWTDEFLERATDSWEFCYTPRWEACDCLGDKVYRPAHCIHAAIYRTWRRQGRPGWNLAVQRFGVPMAVYQLDADMRLYRLGAHERRALSTVEQVNRSEREAP